MSNKEKETLEKKGEKSADDEKTAEKASVMIAL